MEVGQAGVCAVKLGRGSFPGRSWNRLDAPRTRQAFSFCVLESATTTWNCNLLAKLMRWSMIKVAHHLDDSHNNGFKTACPRRSQDAGNRRKAKMSSSPQAQHACLCVVGWCAARVDRKIPPGFCWSWSSLAKHSPESARISEEANWANKLSRLSLEFFKESLYGIWKGQDWSWKLVVCSPCSCIAR